MFFNLVALDKWNLLLKSQARGKRSKVEREARGRRKFESSIFAIAGQSCSCFFAYMALRLLVMGSKLWKVFQSFFTWCIRTPVVRETSAGLEVVWSFLIHNWSKTN